MSEASYVNLSKPTIDDIWKVGCDNFEIYETYLKMTPEFYYTVLCSGIGGEEYWSSLDIDIRDNMTLFEVVLADTSMQQVYVTVLDFFYEETVVFNNSRFYFLKDYKHEDEDLNPENIVAIISDSDRFKMALHWCQEYCGISSEDKKEEKPQFKNEIARRLWEKMKKAEEIREAMQRKKDHALYCLPNTISSLCAYHNSLNYGNIGKLTLPQVRDSLMRLMAIEGYTIHRTAVSVWGTNDDKEFSTNKWMENYYDK